MNPYLDGPGEGTQAAGSGDAAFQTLKARRKGQKVIEPPMPSKDRTSHAIKPSPPRDVPSQEQIAAAQNEWNPDNYLERPPDTTFLHNFNSPAKRKPSVDVEGRKSPRSTSVEDGSTVATKYPVTNFSKDNEGTVEPTQSSGQDAKGVVEGKKTDPSPSKHGRTSSKTFELRPVKKEPLSNRANLNEKPLPVPVPSEDVEEWKSRVQDAVKENDKQETTTVTVEASESSPASDYHSATSAVHSLKTTSTDEIQFPVQSVLEGPTVKVNVDSKSEGITQPSESDARQAKMIFDGDETVVTRENATAWLGEPSPERIRVRDAYMNLFDWQNLNILAALRDLCGRLYLKGEAQQVDRLLDAFSTRWCACNSSHGFKAIGKNNRKSLPYVLTLSRCRTYDLLFTSTIEHRSPSCGY